MNLLTLWVAAVFTMMWRWKKLLKQLTIATHDDNFLHQLEHLEGAVSKVLSLAMVIVILISLWDLGAAIAKTLLEPPFAPHSKTLFQIFGLFLNVLIALEILENITAYLKKHVIQAELVIATSLIAVARKIIILDLEKVSGDEVIGLGIAVLALSISYWIIRVVNRPQN